ncbi:MAG: cupredoxin domain-containing protein [Acidobacteria bacterium]|nr:cupredoxin domain-containing protein [Acidobacteriota bacterium]
MRKGAFWLGLILLTVGGMPAQEPPAEPGVKEIRVTAKKYEYNPSEIHVRAGERVRLILTALDRTHGFQIEELDINEKIFKDKETVIEFVAPTPGTYPFKCSVRCGWRHPWMKGKLIVEPSVSEAP